MNREPKKGWLLIKSALRCDYELYCWNVHHIRYQLFIQKKITQKVIEMYVVRSILMNLNPNKTFQKVRWLIWNVHALFVYDLVNIYLSLFAWPPYQDQVHLIYSPGLFSLRITIVNRHCFPRQLLAYAVFVQRQPRIMKANLLYSYHVNLE
jgi:hypothetical protein